MHRIISETALTKLRRRYPLVSDLKGKARRRMPRFVFDLLEGGTDREIGIARNRRAFDEIEILPRYGTRRSTADTTVELFGRRYSMPIGIAPTGLDGAMWPGATEYLAKAAQALNVPYLVGLLSAATLEQVANWAPDVAWLQLYPLPADNHATTLRIVDRAAAAGIRVLALTIDVPVPPKRPRDLRNGLWMPYLPSLRLAIGALTAPVWLLALANHGMPTFANLLPHSGGVGVADYALKELGGGFDWETIARVRDRWKGPLLLKGILHPEDGDRARAMGIEGIVVSNHGARQFDASPATVDVAPAIRAAIGENMTLLLDSGVESGLDALKAVAVGADAVLAGRAFIYGLGALGGIGPYFVAELLREEVQVAMVQSGISMLEESRHFRLRHPGRWPHCD